VHIRNWTRSFALLTVCGLFLETTLPVLADDAENTAAPQEQKQARAPEARSDINQASEEVEEEVTTVLAADPQDPAGVPRGAVKTIRRLLVQPGNDDVRATKVLEIDAAPAGEILAVQQAEETARQELGKYWIGVQINEVSPALRAQLNLEENKGVLVGAVLPDSPASKADIKQYDILLSIDDQKLNGNEDVLKAIKAADGKDIKLTLLRGGSERSVTIKPAERPKDQTQVPRAPEHLTDVLTWLKQAQPKADGSITLDPTTLEFNVVRPRAALVLHDNVHNAPRTELPESLSITITREGKNPAKISIKQKERQIETTEDKLEAIPEDLRRYVESMLSRPRAELNLRTRRTLVAPPLAVPPQLPTPPAPAQPGAPPTAATPPQPETGDVLIPAPPGQELHQKRVQPFPPGGARAGVEKRIEDLERRIDELQRAVRDHDAKPEPK
jgi:PDZ domain-containing protein